jgi:hypothetical protein
MRNTAITGCDRDIFKLDVHVIFGYGKRWRLALQEVDVEAQRRKRGGEEGKYLRVVSRDRPGLT